MVDSRLRDRPLRSHRTCEGSQEEKTLTRDDLDAFMSDPELAQALEQARITDDIFDVITLRENQHSDMLAWCLNPNEGHGQGDAIIKDFLVAAYQESAGAAFHNKRFFEEWRPSRIRTTTFGAAFLSRELGIEIDLDGKKGRLDLFLVDPVNKIVVTIENKAGRKLSSKQLDDYWNAVRTQVAQRPVFKEYQFAYVVVDRELDDDVDRDELGSKWIVLDYGWLKTSAVRARQQVDRSNLAAQLLMSYCQRQTDWQADEEQRLVDLAASLSTRHQSVVYALRALRRTRIASWTPSMLKAHNADLLLFLHQHRHACAALLAGSGIAAVAADIRRLRPGLSLGYLDVYRTWLAIGSSAADELADGDAERREWPVYVIVRKETSDENERTTFKVRLIWTSSAFGDRVDIETIRSLLEKPFPELAKRKSRNIRRITFGRQMDAAAAVRLALDVADKLERALAGALSVPPGFCSSPR